MINLLNYFRTETAIIHTKAVREAYIDGTSLVLITRHNSYTILFANEKDTKEAFQGIVEGLERNQPQEGGTRKGKGG